MPLLFGENLSSLQHAAIGIYAENSKTKKVLAERNSNLSLMPASCMKIVTTAAALQILGAESRFETHLEYDGIIHLNGVLKGNVYIRGGGDPCLGSDRIAGSPSWKEQIKMWADAIEKLGILKIEGKVIGDATKWEKALAVPSWSWEDLGNYYGAGACALSFHENCYSLFFEPNKQIGKSASLLRTEPPMSLLVFQNEVKTGPVGSGDCACIYGSEFSTLQCIRGTVPAAVQEFAIKGAIPDPASTCADLLVKELQERNIVTLEQNIASCNRKTLVHTTYSPSIEQIVYWTNQKSVNLYAEHLLKKMGEVVYNEGSTAAGIKAVKDFWASQGIDLSGFNMVDGSGLSRKNLITSAQLVAILLKIKMFDSFPVFFASLPQRHASIRAKSGSMSLAKSYAGYTGNIAFAVIVNQCLDNQLMNTELNDFLSNLSTLENNNIP
jgi:D-alanyl-D-alanine carboxypeptidase/D-alanyl-D-alanine-endopeptidase (penicillin-binding protein 4)